MTMLNPGAPDGPIEEKFALITSRHFPEWLGRMRASLAFTAYQAGKLFFLGLTSDGRLAVCERSFARCMGLGVHSSGRSFALATQYQLLRFDDVIPPGSSLSGDHDAAYAPHLSWITGDLDIHDVVMPADGRPIFVNTLFSCLAGVSDGYSFRPVWRPGFVTRLTPEDRCHLNGLACDQDGQPRYVTLVADSDVADGWRDRRANGGMLLDVASGETVAGGLSMPHSPRLYGGRLWLLNSGTGEFGFVELTTGRFEAAAFCPGYARGLAFLGQYAIIGLSLPRKNRTFGGLQLDQALATRGAEARCGLLVVDINTGDITGWARIEGVVRELYDVAILPGVCNPSLIGFVGDEIARIISIDER